MESVRRVVKMEIIGEEVPKRWEGLRRSSGRRLRVGLLREIVLLGGVFGGMRGKRGWQSQTEP